jgi:hypothetical protein
LFSSQDFLTVFDSGYFTAGPADTVCKIVWQMADKNLAVTTPAGVYNTSTARQTFLMYPNWASSGNPRYINVRYSENIGIVVETLPFFASSPNYVERRLIRYNVN